MTNKEIIALLATRLSPKRLNHSIEVANEAERLAKLYGQDEKRLYLAGLLHDITKETAPAEQLKILNDAGIILTDIEKNALKLWHAKSGAEFVKNRLGIDDEEIISAIRFHTTAKKGMTKFEKLLYIADFTSLDRDYPGVEEVREAANKSIKAAMFEGLSFTIADLAKQEKPIHPDTFEAYNEITLER